MNLYTIKHQFSAYSFANYTIILAKSIGEAKSIFDIMNLKRGLNLKILQIDELEINESCIVGEYE